MTREKTEKAPNYTAEQVAELVKLYLDGKAEGRLNPELTETLATHFGKTKRSIVSKLAREKVYVEDPKVAKAPKDDGPAKKELLVELENLGFDTEGLDGATKAAIARVIETVKSAKA